MVKIKKKNNNFSSKANFLPLLSLLRYAQGWTSLRSQFIALQVVRHYHGHLSACHAIDLHPTIDILATCGRDSSARVCCVAVHIILYVANLCFFYCGRLDWISVTETINFSSIPSRVKQKFINLLFTAFLVDVRHEQVVVYVTNGIS